MCLKHKLGHLKISKENSKKVVDLLIYKNQYVLNKKLHNFIGNQKSNFGCRRFLSSHSIQNVLFEHKQRCDEQEITSIRTSNESHLYWKQTFS